MQRRSTFVQRRVRVFTPALCVFALTMAAIAIAGLSIIYVSLVWPALG